MGRVYQAVDKNLGIIVALKHMLVDSSDLPGASQDTHLHNALKREARLLATLRHPALPKVMDYFVTEAGHFLMMEYIPGDDLGMMLEQRGGPFSLDEVLRWADQLLHALDYLHRQPTPIIHHDIKPRNIKVLNDVMDDEQVVLLDFGLAKGMPSYQTRMLGSHNLSSYTVDYAPLEQIQGTETTPRSDLYALGATLYHLLTGGQLPPEASALSRAAAPFNDQPDPLLPLHIINPRIPVEISAVIMQALELQPDARPPSAGAMRVALHEASQKSLIDAAGDAAGAVGTVDVQRIPASPPSALAPPPPLEAPLRLQGVIQRTTGGVAMNQVVFSPDHALLAAAGDDHRAWVWDLASGRVIHQLAGHTDAVQSVAFSLDGHLLASGSEDHTIRVWEIRSGQEIQHFGGSSAPVNHITFSPDGRLLASASSDGVVRLWEVAGGRAAGHLEGSSGSLLSIAFHPHGHLLVAAGADHRIYLWEVPGGRQVWRLEGHRNQVRSVAFSPDGSLLVSGGKDKIISVWDLGRGVQVGALKGHRKTVSSVAFGPAPSPGSVPDNPLLISGSDDKTVRVWNVKSEQEIGRLTGHTRPVLSVAVHARGEMLVSTSEDGTLRLWGVGVPPASWERMEQAWHEQQQRRALRATGHCEICGEPLRMWEKLYGHTRCKLHR